MKKLKKYFVFSFAILLAFGFSSQVFATSSISISSSGDYTSTAIADGFVWVGLYDSTGALVMGLPDGSGNFITDYGFTGTTYHYVVLGINNFGCQSGSDNYATCSAILGVDSATFNLTQTPPPPPPPPSGSGHGISILGGTAPSVGTPVNGANFTSQTATAVQAMLSNKGIGTPLSAVLGIILALIIATWIVAIVRLTSEYRKDEKWAKENKLS